MQPQEPLFDRKLIIGVIVVVIFSILWQSYLNQKYPQPVVSSVTPVVSTEAPKNSTGLQQEINATTETTLTLPKEVEISEKSLPFKSDKISFEISNLGMGLKNYHLVQYTDQSQIPITIGHHESLGLYAFQLNSKPVIFNLSQNESGQFVGDYQDQQIKIKREIKYRPETASFEAVTEIENGPTASIVSIFVPEKVKVIKNSSWLFPSYERQDFFIGHSATTEKVSINHAKQNSTHEYKNVSFVSVGDQYFTASILDQSELAPQVFFDLSVDKSFAHTSMMYNLLPQQNVTLKQILYAGPKEINNLKKIDPAMVSVIDFGWLAFISKPLLWLMKTMYSFSYNWGIAIVLLTLIVRLAVLPIHMTSVRSMRAMQKIQPHIQTLREKYKDDPMAQQREMMQLMREHKANPLGGCLPMLLQIPIFFALYSVIGSSVELYQSPFIFWIKDLSLHDPYFILPLLMGVTMFFQSKLTPMTTVDPMQAKIMLYLPLFFTLFMLYLPAGLTLYMFVSGLFGVAQQMYFLREQNNEKSLNGGSKT